MIIRDARADELDALARAACAQPLLQRYGVAPDRLAADLRAALARGDGVLVVEDGGRAAGFAWFLPSGTFALGGYLRLITLVPGAESRGLGAALLDEVERRVAPHGRALFLLVSHWNDAARRFYAARGYVEVGTVPKLVRDDTDEVIYFKRLR